MPLAVGTNRIGPPALAGQHDRRVRVLWSALVAPFLYAPVPGAGGRARGSAQNLIKWWPPNHVRISANLFAPIRLRAPSWLAGEGRATRAPGHAPHTHTDAGAPSGKLVWPHLAAPWAWAGRPPATGAHRWPTN